MNNPTTLPNRTQRNSGIELLKLLAMAMIILSHSMPVNGDSRLLFLAYATRDIQQFTAVLFRGLGQVGNGIFIVCSAWFLLDSQKVNARKILYMIGDCFTISMLWLLAVLPMGYDLSAKDIVSQFCPITAETTWFVGCYILFYALHPLLNKITFSLSREAHLKLCLVLFFLYCGLNMLWEGTFYYTKLVAFIVLYFFTGYCKNYIKKATLSLKQNLRLLLVGTIGWIGLFALTNFLGLRISFLSDKMEMWISMMNPFGMMMVFSLFNLFRTHEFYSRAINYVSGLTLLIYLFHENYFVYRFLRNDLFSYLFESVSPHLLIVWILALSAATCLASFFLAFLYTTTLQRLVKKVCDILYGIIGRLYERLAQILLKIE